MPGTNPISKTEGVANVGGAATTTASITPLVTPKSCLVVVLYTNHATVAFTNTTTISGNGLTWTKQKNQQSNGGKEQMTVWTGSGTPSAGTIVMTLSQTPASGYYHVWEVQDANRANPVTQAVGNDDAGVNGTTGSATMAALANSFPLIAFFGHMVNEITTPKAGWTELGDTGTTGTQLEGQYVFSKYDLTPTATWTTSSRWVVIALEMASSNVTADPPVGDTKNKVTMVARSGDTTEEGPSVPGVASGYWAYAGNQR